MVGVINSSAEAVILEPDILESKIEGWKIYRARFGHGCVATLTYSHLSGSDGPYLALGGERESELFFYLNINPRDVGRKRADEFLETIHMPEVTVGQGRYTVESYNYRAEVGVIIDPITTEFLHDLSNTKQIKFLENGHEKLAIKLSVPANLLNRLMICIRKN